MSIRKKKRLSRISAVFLTAALISSALTGCFQKEGSIPEGNRGFTVAIGSDTGTMDPAGSIALTWLSYAPAAMDELLTFDENGTIEYRAAKSYEVNEDNTVWTFHLREDARWSDGSPVTSEDFRNTAVRALDPASASGYAVYLFQIENAEEIYDGKMSSDSLGVETPDAYTLIYRLEEPCVYFLDLLRLPVYMPSACKYARDPKSGWDTDPDTSLSNGPYTLKEYVKDQYLVLEKNKYYWNADEIKNEQITFRFYADTQTMAGAYEAGEVDIATSLSSTVMELYEGKDDLYLTNQIATRYIYFNLNIEPFDDVRVRQAFNLALDREELCRIVGEDTEPTYNLVAKYMKDKNTGEYFTDGCRQPFEENVKRARELLAQAGYPDGEGFPVLTYRYPSLEMDSDTAQVIKAQLKENLNIDIKLEAQELQVNYSSRHAGDFDMCRMNWTADFNDPYTYLSMLMSNSTYNCSGICDPEYDRLVKYSDSETDPQKRAELMHRAEQRAVGEQFYIIPLYAMKGVNLVNPDIAGIKENPATGGLEYRYAWKTQQDREET